jgi:uncharacterized iron-regulated membrane protein
MLAPTHSVFGISLMLIILALFGIQWSMLALKKIKENK